MKKWNQNNININNEKKENKFIKVIRKKHTNSLPLDELNFYQKKEETKIFSKNKPNLKSDILLYSCKNIHSNNYNEKNNNNILYRKKKICNMKNNYPNNRIKCSNNLYNKKISFDNQKKLNVDKIVNSCMNNTDLNDLNLIQNKNDNIDNKTNIKEEKYNLINENRNIINEIKEDNNINNISDENYEETKISFSKNIIVNSLINELKIKIDLTKRNIYELNKREESKSIINKINDEQNPKLINSKEGKKLMDIKNIKKYKIVHNISDLSFIKKSQSCEKITILKNKEKEKNLLLSLNDNYSPIRVVNTEININQNNSAYKFDDILLKIKNKNKIDIINNKSEPLLVQYLDNKSLILLSSVNKNIFKNIRIILYSKIYTKLLINRKNNKEDFCKKIIYNLFNHASNKLRFRNKIQLKTKYNYYQYKSIYRDKIRQDLSRTFPKDRAFNTLSNYRKLYNILKAYSNYNKKIGYTQGLNFIAATGIFFFNTEEDVFLFLDCINSRFNLEKNLSIDNINLSDNYNYFCNVLNKYIPDIVKYFEKKGLDHCFFSISWMITLFSNSMKRKYLIKTWCFMILFGWKFFYSFTIQILAYYKKEILSKEENKISNYMKNLLDNDDFCNNYNEIIKNTFNFMNDNIIL